METKRAVLAMGSIFGMAALFLALPSMLPPEAAENEPFKTMGKSANELLPTPLDPSTLLKWDFHVEPSVSTERLRENTVRKIAYGRTSFVTIVETPSGIYSNDALASPHIRYPGIHPRTQRSPFAGLALWNDGRNWVSVTPFTAGSFVAVLPVEACANRPNAVPC